MTPEQIVALRERLDLSQAALGAKVGVSQGAVWRWEAGKRKPRATQLLRLRKLASRKRPNGMGK